MSIQVAHFPVVKTLADFEFKLQPSIDAKLARELATGRFVAGAENVLGPPGVGKTHFAIALGAPSSMPAARCCSSRPHRCSRSCHARGSRASSQTQ